MLYGGNVPLMKCLYMHSVPVSIILLVRFGFASLLAVPLLAANSQQLGANWRPACELAFYVALGYRLQTAALEKAPASVCAVAAACTGVLVQLLECMVDRKRLCPLVALCSLGTVAGVAMFNGAHAAAAAAARPPAGPWWAAGLPGEALALLSTACFAVRMWRSEKLLAESGEGSRSGRSALLMAAGQCTLVFAAYLLINLTGSGGGLGALAASTAALLDGRAWLRAAVCGMLCTGLPFLSEFFAFRHVPPSAVSLIYCSTPVWAVTFAVAFLGEPCGLRAMVAGAGIMACTMTPSALQLLRARANAAEVRRVEAMSARQPDPLLQA